MIYYSSKGGEMENNFEENLKLANDLDHKHNRNTRLLNLLFSGIKTEFFGVDWNCSDEKIEFDFRHGGKLYVGHLRYSESDLGLSFHQATGNEWLNVAFTFDHSELEKVKKEIGYMF